MSNYAEDEDDTEDIERCHFCGGEVRIVETETTLPYGAAPYTVEIPVTLDVRTCYRCDEAWTEGSQEEVKDKAVRKYLAENEISPELRAQTDPALLP